MLKNLTKLLKRKFNIYYLKKFMVSDKYVF